jgi:hypothetical protein
MVKKQTAKEPSEAVSAVRNIWVVEQAQGPALRARDQITWLDFKSRLLNSLWGEARLSVIFPKFDFTKYLPKQGRFML